MIDIIDKYITSSKDNLFFISKYLEENIEFSENKLWSSNEEFNNLIKEIINIYYNSYYLYPSNDFDKIKKYIRFNNKINRKLKQFLLSIIEYYEKNNNATIIQQEEASILYITILLFTSDTLYNSKINNIDNPKKIEKVINNIIDNFAKIRFNKNKDLDSLINNISKYVSTNNTFKEIFNDFNNDISSNSYISINKTNSIYKILYEYDIDDLNKYDGKDIRIVINKENIPEKLMNISYDIAICTTFKMLVQGKNYSLLFPITKDYIKNIKQVSNKLIESRIKYLIDFDEIDNDYDFINYFKTNNLDLYIEVNKSFATKNYNMFMDIKNIIVPEDFLSKNEKYMEIWKDMNINFIIKDLGKKLTEKELLERK